MNGPSGRVARLWRRIHVGRNPLARTSDRVEGVLLLVVIVGVIAALPLAALFGAATYRGQVALSEQQRATRHLAVATLIEDARIDAAAADGTVMTNHSVNVPAKWVVPGEGERTGLVPAGPDANAGAQVPVWLTDSGDPVPPPLSRADIRASAVVVAVFGWMLAALVLCGIYWAGRTILDRRRASQWEREWASAAEKWARF